MQLIGYTRCDDRIFCPVTGQAVFDDNMNPIPSTVRGVWAHEVPDDPILLHPELEIEWNAYVDRINKASEAGDDEVGVDPVEFLDSFERDNWAVFEIESVGIACGPVSQTIWLVLDLGMQVVEEEDA